VRVVTLYGRPECHLCERAREELLALRGELPRFELREVNIDDDDALHARFLERVPVIEVDGEIVCELELDRRRLAGALTAAA
jgi:glutaredoxin